MNPSYKTDALLVAPLTSFPSYKTDAYLVNRRSASYSTSAVLIGQPIVSYSTSALLESSIQCNVPSVANMPILKGVDVQINGTNPPNASVLPNLISINLYVKSC